MPDTATRPEATEYAPYYEKYVSLVPAGDIVHTLSHQHVATRALLASIPEDAAFARYEPGKWSIKEVVGHLIDSERVFAYRALRFARGDRTPLPGFEQDDYVRAADFDARPLGDLTAEFLHVRASTVSLYQSLEEEAWRRCGAANSNEVSVRALAYIIAGHEAHHVNILRERYLRVRDGDEG
ncbi:MAG TPA: DinB family protein [Pyrinomonadaceae bacterium]|nr:DinB family protein [Pyrinomonadaceae bacterium]